MEKRKVIYLVLSSLLLLTASIAVVFAWLRDLEYTNTITLKSGKVEYQMVGSLASGLVVPGQELIETPYQLTNKSTVDSQLRIKIEVIIVDDLTSNILYNGDPDDARVIINIGLGTDFIKETDGFYYFDGMDDGILLSSNTTPIAIISSVVLNGDYIHNNYAHDRVYINIVIQAKQLGYDWQTLLDEEVDFQTGLGN